MLEGTVPRFVFVTSVLASLSSATMIGCSDQPPPKTPKSEDGVPANSLSDARLHGEEEAPKDDKERREEDPSDTKADPTQPYMTKVGDAPPPEPTKPSKGGASSGSKDAMTRAECERVMDRYLELEVASNPQLKNVPPEVIEQAKEMAREKHGEAPCIGTRAQYKCAMAATSTAAWQRCMK